MSLASLKDLDNLKNETRYVFTWIGPIGEKDHEVGNSLLYFSTEVREIFNWMRDVDAVEAKIMFRDLYHREFYFNPYIKEA